MWCVWVLHIPVILFSLTLRVCVELKIVDHWNGNHKMTAVNEQFLPWRSVRACGLHGCSCALKQTHFRSKLILVYMCYVHTDQERNVLGSRHRLQEIVFLAHTIIIFLTFLVCLFRGLFFICSYLLLLLHLCADKTWVFFTLSLICNVCVLINYYFYGGVPEWYESKLWQCMWAMLVMQWMKSKRLPHFNWKGPCHFYFCFYFCHYPHSRQSR